MINSSMKNPIYKILFAYFVIAAFTIYYFDGTGDAGDSISHFLFAKYAPHHPELYFNHWAKPVFVLLASPFAQFGFVGMKIFNALISLLTIFFTYKIAKQLNLKNAIIVCAILIFTPVYFALTFSGLTEPLFALFIALGIYFLLNEKYLAACILFSFLPFVRSEGLILLGVIGIYLLAKGKWKSIPWLATGHIIYSFAGYFVYHDLLWVFRKIPYATMDSVYGHGNLAHFAQQLFYFFGLPIYILFALGLLSIIWSSIKLKSNYQEQILFFLGFLTFFIAHTLFWYFGIFGSMGLTRVFIAIMPIMGIIALKGYNFLSEEIFGKMKIPQLLIKGLFLVAVIVFPFTENHAALNFDRDLKLTEDQKAATETAKFIVEHDWKNHRAIYAHPYLGMALNIDPFDSSKRMELNKGVFNELKYGDIIIWDNLFALNDMKISKEDLDGNSELTSLYNSHVVENGREISFSVYVKK